MDLPFKQADRHLLRCHARGIRALLVGLFVAQRKKNVQQVVTINNPVGLSFILYDHNPLTAGIVMVSHHRQQVSREKLLHCDGNLQD